MHFHPLDAAAFVGLAMVAWGIFVSCALLSPPVDEDRPSQSQYGKQVKRFRRTSQRGRS